MRCLHFFWIVTLVLFINTAFTVQGEETAKLSQEQLEAIAIQPATNWGKTGDNIVPEMLPLFKEESIQFEGQTKKYRLHVPENLEPGKKYPMILWLHGAGERGTDNKIQLVHLHHIITSLIGEKKRDFFLLVPQYGNMEYWSQDDSGSTYQSGVVIPPEVENGDKSLEEFKNELLEQTKAASDPDAFVSIKEHKAGTQTMTRNGVTTTKEITILLVSVESPEKKGGPLEFAFDMVDQVIENYPVDTDRITVSGLSTGGDGTWDALERRPELFAAAVPLVSWTSLSEPALEKSPILKKIPIWAIYSSDDSMIDDARAEFERAEKAGCNVKKTEFGICGHTAWTPAMLQADIFNWLLSRGKKGGEYVQVFDPGIDPDDMKGIVDVATRDPGKPAMAPAVTPTQVPTVMRAASTPVPPEPVGRASTARQANPSPRIPAEAQERMRQRQEMAQQRIEEMRSRNRDIAILPTVSPGMQDEAYARIAQAYYMLLMRESNPNVAAEISEKFTRSVRKISPQRRMQLIMQLSENGYNLAGVSTLEKLLDEISIPPTVSSPWGDMLDRSMPQQPSMVMGAVEPVPPSMPIITRQVPLVSANAGTLSEEETSEEESLALSAARIIEECDRPWAMTSDSLYGMFPADWGKEAEAVPEFIVNSDSNDLAKKLAVSIGKDDEAADFVAACRSILLLQNKPMSSPWFETGGGRLRSDIEYTLSTKGEMFVRFLKTVKDSGGNSPKAAELAKIAERTLEKIDMVLAK